MKGSQEGILRMIRTETSLIFGLNFGVCFALRSRDKGEKHRVSFLLAHTIYIYIQLMAMELVLNPSLA